MNPRGFQLGRLFGTDIFASFGFLLLLAWIMLVNRAELAWAAIWSLAIVVSILVHEFGHVFAARRAVGGPCFVVLWFLGGLCVHPPASSRAKQVFISLMGPAFGLVLGLVALAVQAWAPVRTELLVLLIHALVFINLFWTALNLLPIWPLDGGQALRAALAGWLGGGRAARVVRAISIAIAAAGAIVALRLGYRFAMILAIILAAENLLGRGPTHD